SLVSFLQALTEKPELSFLWLLVLSPISFFPLFSLDPRYSSSLGIVIGLAPEQRFGMPLQKVAQHAQRSGGAGDLLQGVAQILLGGSVPADEGRIRALEYAVGRDDRAANVLHGGLQTRRDFRVQAVHGLVRALERLIQRNEHLGDVSADRFVRQLIELDENAVYFLLQVCDLTRHHRQFHRVLAPFDLGLGRVGKIIEGDEELTGNQAAAAQLRAQAALLDLALDEGVALLHVLDRGFARGWTCLQARQQTLGKR